MLHLHLKECPSTQRNAFELLAEGHTEVLVSCETQTQGVGRREREWFSADKCLALSFNLRPSNTKTLTSLELGVLIKRFLWERLNARLQLKWPNDIYSTAGKKCGGILIQGSNRSFVAGIGINLSKGKKPVPKELEKKIGFLFDKGADLEIKKLSFDLREFVLNNRLDDKTIRREWEASCIHLKKEVEAVEDNKAVRGVFKGIGELGQALLATDEGDIEIFNATLNINP